MCARFSGDLRLLRVLQVSLAHEGSEQFRTGRGDGRWLFLSPAGARVLRFVPRLGLADALILVAPLAILEESVRGLRGGRRALDSEPVGTGSGSTDGGKLFMVVFMFLRRSGCLGGL